MSLLDRVLGIERATDRYLDKLARSPELESRHGADRLLAQLRREAGPKFILGETVWKEPVVAPLNEFIMAHGLVTGGSGSGKTRFGLLIVDTLIDLVAQHRSFGFGVLDAKGELYQGTLFLLMRKINQLAEQNPEAARALRRRVIIVDFSNHDPLSAYNITARWPHTEPDFFAANRADLLFDLLPGGDELSLVGSALLQKCILLLSESGLPLTFLDEVLQNEALRQKLLSCSNHASVAAYFARQFPSVPRPTIEALRRRLNALFSSEGVRLSLAGNTAPDFRLAQDEGKIVLVNCFGQTISRSVRRLLQALVVSDIAQAVFSRRRKGNAFLWLCDEAQNLFVTPKLRENMGDVLAMSRSFGSFFLCLTQNITTAVQDPRLLKTLWTNVRWSLSMRGEPSDCALLKPVLPVTGRKLRPQVDPFREKTLYTFTQEQTREWEAIANLPDRVGWLWLRTRSAQALKLRTRELVMPENEEMEDAIRPLWRDPSLGRRLSRKEYLRQISQRDEQWLAEPEPDLDETFKEAYQRMRGGAH